ncbi:MAG: hypothetical protein AVDCRST_MAG52-1554 [uncultured Blastococcus sp.]|uniref:Capsular polysaccharide biosynthesis protein n=1 Tax=uncultured Blastococcus sp. TaxID=217144 RepID=A0A6J4I1K0_9ACTN|nr:MAG: hypothetical protein AVDCRST_MAG52-1554 [uncultured Blastococcus sp.]
MILACALALTAAPLLLEQEEPSYQADALVVARQLGVPNEALPRLGQAVFDGGALEARIAADPTVGGNTNELIPERLSLVAAEDSIVLVVQARDPVPATAAQLATLGATVLAEELNRGGAGVGVFALQAPATVPTEPLDAPDHRLLAAAGALAGVALGLGLVALVAALRRPVLTAGDVWQAVGVPLLGTVRMPRVRRRTFHGPVGVRGIATVTRWLGSVPSGRLLFVSSPSAAALRRRILVMAAVALGVLRSVRAEAPQEVLDAIRRHRLGNGAVHPLADATDKLVLVDGSSPMEVIDPQTTHVSVVIVAPRGVSRRRLRALASDYVDGGLVGVVLVELRLGPRPPAARRVSDAPPPSDAENSGQVSDVPEPERA